MYNIYEVGNMFFYGKVYGIGNVVLDGGNNVMIVDVLLIIGNNISFIYIIGVIMEVVSNQFIIFVDKIFKCIYDNVEINFYYYFNVCKIKEDDGFFMDFCINMLIEVIFSVIMKIIMDFVVGDNIIVIGNGNL